MKKHITLIDRSEKKLYTILLGIVLLLFIAATIYTKFNPFQLITEQKEFWRFISQDFFPPKLGDIKPVLESIFLTIAMALSSAFVAGVLALFVAMFGSEYISSVPKFSKVIRGFATFLRNIPALVWAFILFSSLGIGTGVGFIALCITSFAFMTRAFIESIDEISQDSVESLQVVGATFWQRVFQGVFPSCVSGFISWFLYCVEVNIRSSTIVGMVGGGGIGLVLFSYLKSFKYHTAAGIILVIAGMVICVDLLTGYLRKKVVE